MIDLSPMEYGQQDGNTIILIIQNVTIHRT
jgi:hypothetical protein